MAKPNKQSIAAHSAILNSIIHANPRLQSVSVLLIEIIWVGESSAGCTIQHSPELPATRWTLTHKQAPEIIGLGKGKHNKFIQVQAIAAPTPERQKIK